MMRRYTDRAGPVWHAGDRHSVGILLIRDFQMHDLNVRLLANSLI